MAHANLGTGLNHYDHYCMVLPAWVLAQALSYHSESPATVKGKASAQHQQVCTERSQEVREAVHPSSVALAFLSSG